MATSHANPLGCTHNVVRHHIPFHYLLLRLMSFHSTSAAGRVEHIYAIRFFQGISESSTFVGTHYILGAYVSSLARRLDNYSCRCTLEWHSWYKPGELGKRSGIFTSSGLIGTLYVGPLVSWLYERLTWLYQVFWCASGCSLQVRALRRALCL